MGGECEVCGVRGGECEVCEECPPLSPTIHTHGSVLVIGAAPRKTSHTSQSN